MATGKCEQVVQTAALLQDADERYWDSEEDSSAETRALDDLEEYFRQIKHDLDDCPAK
jgi:hypothetical protein